jgi:hypothetical protein
MELIFTTKAAVDGAMPGKTSVTSTPTSEGYKQLKFNFSAPKGKVANLMSVLNYMQSKCEQMDIFLRLDNG